MSFTVKFPTIILGAVYDNNDYNDLMLEDVRSQNSCWLCAIVER